MLKMSRGLYTGRNLSKTLGLKRTKIGDLICDHDLTHKRFGANLLFYQKYIMRLLLARLPPLHSKMLTNREMVNFQKWDFFRFFFYTVTINCVTTGARKKPIE